MAHKNQLYIPTEDFYLQPIYSCIHCRANLAHHRDLISKSFQGSQGRAYLFSNVVNVGSLVAEERMLLTGLHYVADIYCECCSFILGWKYERAFEPNQRYKEGKFIIELANLIKDNCWDIDCNKWKLRLHPLKMRQLFGTDWNMSVDSLAKNSAARQTEDKFLMKIQSKSTFIRELSRDFQQIFGISEKIVTNNPSEVAKNTDNAILTDEVSNSTMSTSIERPGPGDSYMRMNSDSDNIDFLNDSLTHSLTVALSEQKTIVTQANLMTSSNGSTDNNSLNTSFNSTKGLLEASSSSNRMTLNDNREKSLSRSSGNYVMPFTDVSLSVTSGTSSCKTHSKNHGRSKHKCRSRHSSNVVNPQKLTSYSKKRSTVPPGEGLPISKPSGVPPSHSDQNN